MEVGRHTEEKGLGGVSGRRESQSFAPVCPHVLRTVGLQGRHPGPVPSGHKPLWTSQPGFLEEVAFGFSVGP